MPLKVSFELSDRDLRYFRRRMREVRTEAKGRGEADIVRAASDLLREMREGAVPDFVRERIENLSVMIDMLGDRDFAISGTHRTHVVNAMAYFAETEDLIPDQIPGLGFLDDAIIVELVVQDLHPEIRTYEEFCRARAAEEKRRGREDSVTREEWVKRKRQQAHRRMRSRRTRRNARGRAGGGRSPLSLY